MAGSEPPCCRHLWITPIVRGSTSSRSTDLHGPWAAPCPGVGVQSVASQRRGEANKFQGNVETWPLRAKSFEKFFRCTNPQWPDLLAKVESLRGKHVTTSHEDLWSAQLGLGPMGPWKDQLNEVLESYTTGPARRLVDSCGEIKALDC